MLDQPTYSVNFGDISRLEDRIKALEERIARLEGLAEDAEFAEIDPPA